MLNAQIMTADTTFRCAATPCDVRRMLGVLRAHLRAENIPDDECGNIEIALAEALNNIVEHAYRPGQSGTITLTLSVAPARLCCELRDRGVAMPELAPPGDIAPDFTGWRRTLPEGGFGWSLIHAMTTRCHYVREGAENRLILEFDLGTS